MWDIYLSRSELESKEAEISDLKTNTSAVDDLMKSQEVDKAALAQANLKIGKLNFFALCQKFETYILVQNNNFNLRVCVGNFLMVI